MKQARATIILRRLCDIHENTTNGNRDCANCHIQYDSADDEKAAEEWLKCVTCYAWYH